MTAEEFEELKKFLTKTPAAVRELTAGLTESQTRWKPSATEFSVVENICHLRDIEEEGYRKRIGRILMEDMPFLPDLDGSRLALERRYNEQELEAALASFTVAREENMQTIQNLSSEQLTRGGTFEQIGPVTLQRLLEMMQEHDRAHLLELEDVRRKVG
jgi:Protein of unknown function (DUF664).